MSASKKSTADISQGRKKALIISVSDYNDKKLQSLDFCKNDGEQMYQVLMELEYEIPDNLSSILLSRTIGTMSFHFK
jgi:hypothetical protein